MKNYKKLFLNLFASLLIVATFLFAGCDFFKDEIPGTYYFEKLSATQNGVTIEINRGDDPSIQQDFCVFTAFENGTATLSSDQFRTGTWTIKEGTNNIVVFTNSDGEVLEATHTYKTLTFVVYEDGIKNTIVLKK